MGKRELLLIAGFFVAGAVLYHLTAPATPNEGGFSFRTMVDSVRREIGPHEEYLGDEREVTLEISTALSEIRIARVHQLEVRGTGTAEARLQIKVFSTGLDEEEARGFARRVALEQRRSGDVLSLDFEYPPEARQRTALTLEIPARLRVRVTRVRGGMNLRNVGAIELDETGGEARLASVDGAIRGSHSGGELIVEGAREVDLTTRRADVTLARIQGDARLDMSGGSLMARGVSGAINLDANRASIELEDAAGAITADVTQGSLEATAVGKPVRIDARGTEIHLELARAVPVTAFTTDESIELRLPEGAGVTFDATVEDGRIRLPEGAPAVTRIDHTQRAAGPYRGGGPTLALRTSHADIVVR